MNWKQILSSASKLLLEMDRSFISIYLYGSAVEKITNGLPVKPIEVDILIVFKGLAKEGGLQISREAKSIFNRFIPSDKFVVINNGVPPIKINKDLSVIDIIDDGTENFTNKDPISLATSLKPKILLSGIDFYSKSKVTNINEIDKIKLASSVSKYIKREFFNRNDLYANYAIVKSVFFLSSMIDNDSAVTNNLSIISDILSKRHQDYFEKIKFFIDLRNNLYSTPHCQDQNGSKIR